MFGVGEPAAPPEINMETDIKLAYTATDVDIKAKVKDASTRKYKLHYSLDDGSEQVLSATEKTLSGDDFTDPTIQEHGTEYIPGTNSQQGIVGKVPIPADWEENSVHKLQVWAKNDKYAMSDVKTVYIMKRPASEGGDVVEAQKYLLSFDGNGGTGTPPSALTVYEGTKVTLQITTMTKTGYTFMGWSPDEGVTLYQPGQEYTMPSGATTLKAVWLAEVIVTKPADIMAVYGNAITPVMLQATGGAAGAGNTGNYTFKVAEGYTLPAGLTLTADGKLSGTPTTITLTGGVTVKVTVKDKDSVKEASTTLQITVHKRSITVAGAANTEKVYDAITGIVPGTLTLANVVPGDTVTASTASAAFNNSSAGVDKELTLNGIQLSGIRKDNYTIGSTVKIKGKVTARPITVKPKDTSMMVGVQKPVMQIEEVKSGSSALQGSDTLASLGTPAYTYPGFKDEKGIYDIEVSLKDESKNYQITCKKGTLTVGQDDPKQSVNYRVTGTYGPNNNGWYNSEIVIEPFGNTYDSFADGKASIKVQDTEKEVELQLKNKSTGQITSIKKVTYKSDTIAPAFGEAEIEPKDGGVLGDVGRTLTFGHFFKKEVQVTLPLSDATSGLKKLEYKLPGKSYQEVAVKEGSKEAKAVFELPLGTNGTIQLRVTDIAGNQSQEKNLEKDGAKVWMVENEAPEISNYSTDAVQKNGWYQTDVKLKASVSEPKSGLNNVALTVNESGKEILLEKPKTLIPSYAFDKTFGDNGRIKVMLAAEDNATNTSAEKEITLQIDKELPKLTNISGNPSEWQKEEAKISFQLSDEVSGLDTDEAVKVVKNGTEEVEVKVSGGTYTFITKGNAVYTIKAWDKAGNELAEENNSIVVNKIQTEKPKPPVEDEIIGTITTPGGETEVPEEKDGWYSSKKDIELDISNIKNPEEGCVSLTYIYKVWKEGDDISKAEEIRLKDDGSNKPTIEGDGIWHIEIWLEDEAKNKSDATEVIIRNDATKPTAASEKENLIIRNEETAKVEVNLSDKLSGVDESTIQVKWRNEAVKTDIKKNKNEFTCSFKPEKGGRYKVTSFDKAGNRNEYTVIVTSLNAQVNCQPGINAKSDKEALLDSLDLSEYKNGETVQVALELKPRQESEISGTLREYIASLFKDRENTGAFYFDTSVIKYVTDADGNAAEEKVTKTKAPISISIEVPENMRGNEGLGITREHGGSCRSLETAIKENGSAVAFETNEFSDYVLYKYKEKAKQAVKGNTPLTGDLQSSSYIFVAVFAAAVSAFVIITQASSNISRKKKRNRRK